MQVYLLFGAAVLAGLILILKLGKENKVFYPIGALLIALGGCILANELTDGMIFRGWYVWPIRGVIAAAAAWLIWLMVREHRKTAGAEKKPDGLKSAADIYGNAAEEEESPKTPGEQDGREE